MKEHNQRVVILAQCLGSHPLFSELSEDDLEALARAAYVQDVPPGRKLWGQGSPGDSLVIVVRGHLEVKRVGADGHEHFLTRLGPGAAIGETSLLLGDFHDAAVTALSPCRLIVLPRPEFKELLRQRPSIEKGLRPREDICLALEAPRFSWQSIEERVALVCRRHTWMLYRGLFWPFVCLLIVVPISYIFTLSLLFWAIPAVCLGLWIIWNWAEWRNDVLIITNRRLVHVERQLLFYERQEQASLDRIQDVSVEKKGLGAALLGYGHLIAQTAGATGQIIFSHTPRPDFVKEVLFEQMDRYQALQRAMRRSNLESDLRKRLGLTIIPEEPTNQDPLPLEQIQPESRLDAIALHLTKMIQNGFPRLRQQQGDVIIWRKHWVVLMLSLLWPALAAMVAVMVPLLLQVSIPPLVAGAALALILLWVWWQWENWRNDVYILTPDRIIDIESIPLRLHTSRREGSLANIQNITYVVPDMLAGLLNYGDVTIETAGQSGNFTFSSVFAPAEVQADIAQYAQSFREKQQEKEQAGNREALADLLAAYERLRSELGGGGSAANPLI